MKGLPRNTLNACAIIQCFFFKKNIFSYLFLAALGLCCCSRAFSSRGEWGLLFIMIHMLLIAVTSLLQSRDSRRTGFSS